MNNGSPTRLDGVDSCIVEGKSSLQKFWQHRDRTLAYIDEECKKAAGRLQREVANASPARRFEIKLQIEAVERMRRKFRAQCERKFNAAGGHLDPETGLPAGAEREAATALSEVLNERARKP